jgi:hypothetical protein
MELTMLDRKILKEADKVYRKASKKDGVLYKVAHSRRKNKSEPYSGQKILEAYERNLPDYHDSREKAVKKI